MSQRCLQNARTCLKIKSCHCPCSADPFFLPAVHALNFVSQLGIFERPFERAFQREIDVHVSSAPPSDSDVFCGLDALDSGAIFHLVKLPICALWRQGCWNDTTINAIGKVTVKFVLDVPCLCNSFNEGNRLLEIEKTGQFCG